MLFLNDAEIVVAQSKVKGHVLLPTVAILDVASVRIFKGVAVGIALTLRTARGRASEKFLEARHPTGLRAEIKGSTESAIEDLGYGSAPEFVAEFNVVLTMLPGNIVDEMPVGIHALARVTLVGTDRSKSRYAYWWESEIIGRSIGGARADGVQADAGGIEAAILREESLCEAVPA